MNDIWKEIRRLRDRLSSEGCRGAAGRKVLADLAALLAEAQRRDEQRDGLLREVTLLLSGTGVRRVIEIVMDAVIRLSGAQRGFVLLARPDGAHEIAAARNMERATISGASAEISRRVVASVLADGKAVRLEDALHTPPYSMAESITRLKILSVLCVPIRDGARPLGALYLENRTMAGIFTEDTESLIADFAERIAGAVRNAEAFDALRERSAAIESDGDFENIVGRHPALREALRTAAIAARGDIPVLIEGESGTGKELVARACHRASPRSERAFVGVNCAALPATLLESELFGHRRGAFTGATTDRAGLFATADRGTLFLDEIGEMPPELQAKLLRVLQDGEYRPVGSDATARADVRVISATRRSLDAEVKAGRFREDLYFRLKGVRVALPPLRERREDIPLLIARFLGAQHPGGKALEISAEARACLLAYDYPGNVRELETVIRRAVLFAREGVIGTEALPPELARADGEELRLPVSVPATGAELIEARKRASQEAARAIERAFLHRALAAAQGRPGEAARIAGMNRSQFARMLSKHGMTGRRTR